MSTQLAGKTYVVTGATSGIGLAVAEGLASQGADVIGIGRSVDRCRIARQQLAEHSPQVQVNYLSGDLALPSQVRELATRIYASLAEWGKDCLDGLVNNAGTFTFWMELTPEGFEKQWAVNHLAAFLLTNELLPQLQKAPEARVVTVSSASHYGARMHWDDIQLRRRYNGLRAYGQSKLANVLFTLELNRRLGPASTVRACAADPGLVNTEIGSKGTPRLVRWFWGLRSGAGVAPQQAAQGILYLLTEQAVNDVEAVYWKNGVPIQPDRRALDAAAAVRLWRLSEQMCGLRINNSQEER